MSSPGQSPNSGYGALGTLLDDTAGVVERSLRHVRSPSSASGLGGQQNEPCDGLDGSAAETLVSRIESLLSHLRSAIQECTRCRKRLAIIKRDEKKLRREQSHEQFTKACRAQEGQLKFAMQKRFEILSMMLRVVQALDPSIPGLPQTGGLSGAGGGGHPSDPSRSAGAELGKLLSLGNSRRGMLREP